MTPLEPQSYNGFASKPETKRRRGRQHGGVIRATHKMMLKIILIQLAVCLISALIAGVGFSSNAGKFVLIGSLCGWGPGALFALNLSLLHNLPPTFKVAVWFAGEIFKILLSVILLFLVYQIFKGETQWLPLIIGLIVSLQANIFALMVTK